MEIAIGAVVGIQTDRKSYERVVDDLVNPSYGTAGNYSPVAKKIHALTPLS